MGILEKRKAAKEAQDRQMKIRRTAIRYYLERLRRRGAKVKDPEALKRALERIEQRVNGDDA